MPNENTTNSRSLRVLVVDDDPAVRTSVSMLLRHLGHQVQIASSGSSALAIVEQTALDVAFIDLRMPDMPGNELARELKRLRSQLRLILITGTDIPGALGPFESILVKPFSSEELIAVLARGC